MYFWLKLILPLHLTPNRLAERGSFLQGELGAGYLAGLRQLYICTHCYVHTYY